VRCVMGRIDGRCSRGLSNAHGGSAFGCTSFISSTVTRCWMRSLVAPLCTEATAPSGQLRDARAQALANSHGVPSDTARPYFSVDDGIASQYQGIDAHYLERNHLDRHGETIVFSPAHLARLWARTEKKAGAKAILAEGDCLVPGHQR
jgi:hypothetical protein